MAPEPAKANSAVLIVEDCDAVLTVMTAMLRPLEGCELLQAQSCDAALEIAKHKPIHLLVADLSLPDGLGTGLAIALRTMNPDLKIVFTSGTPMACWPDQAMQELAMLPYESWTCLPKPFLAATALEVIRHFLSALPSS